MWEWPDVLPPLAIYLYCLLRATAEPPPGLSGIDDSRVRTVDLGGLWAWVSDIGASTIQPTPERARDHDRVVRTALEGQTPLPVRFGQIIADERALADVVSSRKTALESALERVMGAVEMTVRVLIRKVMAAETGTPVRESGTGSSGRDYLERVAATQREERNVLAEERIVRGRVSSAVRALVRAESFAGVAPGSRMATFSHLVPRENVEAYRSALLVLRSEEPALTIMVSGPWAPYSFTEGVGA